MKVRYVAALAIASALSLGAAAIPTSMNDVSANPCAATVNPCAAANPCASKNPGGAAAPCAATNPCAAASQITAPRIFAEDGVAIRGADPVAYFTQGQPVEGRTEFAYDWNGATWLFSSAQNRARFISDPEAYAPQYGGYCAFAASEGNLASTVPEAWKIVDGKLYLNYSLGVQQLWDQDIPGHIAKANANWPGILTQASR